MLGAEIQHIALPLLFFMRDDISDFKRIMGRITRGLWMHRLGWCARVEQAPNR